MIQIGDTIVSEELLDRKFVCNLNACKGACCVEGDAGAPLEEEELPFLETVYPKVKKYLSDKSIAVLEESLFTTDVDGEYVTPLVNEKECAYVYFEEDGTSKCAIEKAFLNNEIEWKKPISCNLFPVRLKKYKDFTAVNYAYWDICDDACLLGEKLGVKTYEFLKEPLIRNFGMSWYNELKLVDEYLENEKSNSSD